jgi:hypothetical protein
LLRKVFSDGYITKMACRLKYEAIKMVQDGFHLGNLETDGLTCFEVTCSDLLAHKLLNRMTVNVNWEESGRKWSVYILRPYPSSLL